MVKFLGKIRITVNFTKSRARETLDELNYLYFSQQVYLSLRTTLRGHVV